MQHLRGNIMVKKKYVTPELDLLILEQSDIITVSGEGHVSGENPGIEDEFGWGD